MITPQDPTIYCDAAYIAPNGDFYGKTGEAYQNLHIEIEDELVESGIIDCEKQFARTYLEMSGWVIVHGNWVQYPGYNNEKWFKKQNIPMTSDQLLALKLYAFKYTGSLRFGYQDVMSVARFEMLYFRNQEKMVELFAV